jgi:hypothetical protein
MHLLSYLREIPSSAAARASIAMEAKVNAGRGDFEGQ